MKDHLNDIVATYERDARIDQDSAKNNFIAALQTKSEGVTPLQQASINGRRSTVRKAIGLLTQEERNALLSIC